MIIKFAHRTARICITLVGILLIVLAVLTAGARLGLPLLAAYKGDVESRVSDYLRSPVNIGEISLSWEGFGPLLKAQSVEVLESSDRTVTLKELLIDVNLAKSLYKRTPVINELTLVGASLAIEVDEDGKLRLHGMESVSATPGSLARSNVKRSGKGVDVVAWLLNARKVGLLDTQLTLIDVKADRRLVVEDLNIRAENSGDIHQLRLDLKLPKQLGGSVEAGIDLIGHADNLRSSDGDLYLRADTLRIQSFSELLSVGGVLDIDRNAIAHISTGVSVELWGRWEDGKLVSARGPVGTGPIIDTDIGQSVLDSVGAMIALTRDSGKYVLDADDIQLSRHGENADIGQLTASWGAAKGSSAKAMQSGVNSKAGAGWALSASGSQLPLNTVSAVAGTLLGHWQPGLASQIDRADASGDLLNWTLALNKLQGGSAVKVSMDADLSRLGSEPVASLPGFGPLDGHIRITDSVGEVSLLGADMNLPWPAYTTKPLSVESLQAVFNIDARDQHRLLVDADLALADHGIDTSTRIKAVLLAGQSPHLDIQSSFSASDLNALKAWLPRHKMRAGLKRWLDRAIEGGQARNGQLLFFGNVADFPFEDGEGVFRANVDIVDGQLAFLKSWPVARGIDGRLDLNGFSLSSYIKSAHLDGFDISKTQVRIDKLNKAVLHIDGTAQGKLQSLLDFSNNGPLQNFLRPVLFDVTANGMAQMDLGLQLQLYRKKTGGNTGQTVPASNQVAAATNASSSQKKSTRLPLSVDGSIFLNGNSVKFGRAKMVLENAQGAIGFDANGIRVNNLRAKALQQAVLINAKTSGLGRQASTNVSIKGALKSNEVMAHYGIPMHQFLSGSSGWELELEAPHSSERMRQEGLGLRISSDLVGTTVDLPFPIYKGSGKARPLLVQTAFRSGSQNQQWDIRSKGLLHGNVQIVAGKMKAILLRLGEGLLSEQLVSKGVEGLRIEGQVESLPMDTWVESIARVIKNLPADDGTPSPILAVSTDLTAASLQLGNTVFGAARIRMNSDAKYLNAVLSNASLRGSFRYPRAHWSKEDALKVRIEHMDMAVITALQNRSEQTSNDKQLETTELDPRLLPAIDARISELTQGSRVLRDVVLRAVPEVAGLSIKTLGFAYQHMQLIGNGYWRLLDPQGVSTDLDNAHQTKLNLVLQSDNFGAGLAAIGVEDVLSEGEGTVEAHLAWPGPIYKPSLATLDGSVKLQLERGNIIPLEPGAGKMVGLFALQALPRRLDFDFKDVTADGLAFKKITGDLLIDGGVADVALIQLSGPIGVIDVSGQSNLNTREFDQTITVLPRVSAALPVIGAISGGASAGIGALVAAGFLKALGIDLDRLGLRNYSLTGKWDKPVLETLNAKRRRSR